MTGEASATLLERDAEIAVMDEALASAGRGCGSLVLLEGEPGAGKTELLAAFRERARVRGADAVHARASVLERGFGFAIVRQLFEARIAGPESPLLGGRAGLAAPLFEPRAASPQEYETLQGLHWLCANLARERPLLVAIDDVQWADPPSARFVHYLLGRLEQLPVVLALARCAGEPDTEPELLAAIASSPVARVVVAAPLSQDAVGRLASQRLGEPSDGVVDSLREATGGNPFLLHALLDELASADPEAVRASAPAAVARDRLARIDRAAPDARAVATAVAVLELDATPARVAALAGLDERAAARAAGALADRGLMRCAETWSFAHPVVRTAIYASLSTVDRVRAHAAAAALLAQDGAGTESLAAHLARTNGGGGHGAVGVLREAAATALDAGRPADAVAYLRRALAEPAPEDRPGMLAQLGRAELRLSDPAAAEHLSAALEHCGDAADRADIGLDLARALVMAGRCGEVAPMLDGLVVELERAGRSAPRLRAELRAATPVDRRRRPLLTGVAAARAELRAATPVDRRRQPLLTGVAAAHEADAHGSARRVLLANAAFEALGEGGDAASATALARRALDGGALLRAEGSESLHYYRAAWTLALCDDLDEADEALQAAAGSARRHGSRLGSAVATCFQAAAVARRGQVATAAAAAAGALDAALDGWSLGVPLAAACRAAALLERDELAAAEELIEELGMPRAIPGSAGAQLVRYERGRIRAARGQVEDGLEDLLAAAGPPPARGVRGLAPAAWYAETATLLVTLERQDEAEQLTREALARSQLFGAPSTVATARRLAGLVARGSRGRKHLAEAVALSRRSPARLEHARALVDHGAALRRGNRRSAARAELRAGLDLAERCGAIALAKRARVELQAAGTRTRRPLRKGVDALTASERRVARLARTGMSNRAIAKELFVTVKTVEWHLGQTYRKLDVGSRKELPAVLDDPGGAADAGGDARVDPDANAPRQA